MIESATVFAAPAGAPSGAARSPAKAPPGNGDEGHGFAAFLAQSRQQDWARAESAKVEEHASVPPDPAPDEEDKTDAAGTDAANGADVAAQIVLAAADHQPAVAPAGSRHSTGTPGITPEPPAADDGSAAAVSGPLARDAAPAPAIGMNEGSGLPELLAQSTGDAVVGGGRATARGQATVSPQPSPAMQDMAGAAAAGVAIDEHAAQYALAAAESLRGSPHVRGRPDAGKPGIAPARPAGDASADAAPGISLAGLLPVPGEPAAADPAIAAIQAAGRSIRGASRADALAAAGQHEGLAATHASDPLNGQGRSTELHDGAVSRDTDESRLSVAQYAATDPVVNLAASAATHAGGMHGMSDAGPASTLLVPTHVESPAWSKDFGQHIIRLAVEGQPAAEIHLNPPDWGPIRVSIEIRGQDATLQFTALHPQTREALEGAMPRLREMFAADSLTLTGASVSGQSSPQYSPGSQGQRFDQPPAATGNRHTQATGDAEPVAAATRSGPAAGRSRVDLFA